MVSVRTRLRNPELIVTPISFEEANEDLGFSSLYVLYKNENNEIEIGMPDMMSYFPALGNMYGYEAATEKAFFYNGASDLEEMASTISDKPVYRIQPSDDRKVESYDIINGVDVKLDDVLNGNFKVVSNKTDEDKHVKHR